MESNETTVNLSINFLRNSQYSIILLESAFEFAVFSLTFWLITNTDIGVSILDSHNHFDDSIDPMLQDFHVQSSKFCEEEIIQRQMQRRFHCPRTSSRRVQKLLVFGLNKEIILNVSW